MGASADVNGDSASPAIVATEVVREYQMGDQRVRALDGLSMRLDGGQFVSIIGPSGAGKSTLLHVMGALDAPDSGQIIVDGCDIGAMTDDEQSTFRRQRVGFVFQFFNLVPTLSAWENVALPRLLDGTTLRRGKSDAIELLSRVGLSDRVSHRPAELSGGQMQRVAIARSLIMNPRVLLCDEPTGNLDSSTGASILELLTDAAHDGSGRLVVMVTHDNSAAAIADTTLTVRDGRIA